MRTKSRCGRVRSATGRPRLRAAPPKEKVSPTRRGCTGAVERHCAPVAGGGPAALPVRTGSPRAGRNVRDRCRQREIGKACHRPGPHGGLPENTVPKFNQLERRDAVDTRHPGFFVQLADRHPSPDLKLFASLRACPALHLPEPSHGHRHPGDRRTPRISLRRAFQNRMLRVRNKVRPHPAARGPSVAAGFAVLVESFASVRL